MVLKFILIALALVAMFFINPRTIKVLKLQRILSNDFTGFITYLSASREWEYSTQQMPNSIRLVYFNIMGSTDTLFLKYTGIGSEERALKQLIRGYERTI